MKSIKFLLFLCIGMMLLTTVSCSNDNEQKETTVKSLNKGDLSYSFNYIDSDGVEQTFTKDYTLDQYNLGQHELPSSDSLFQHDAVSAGDTNTTCKILCATLCVDSLGIRSYMGYLIDDNTGQLMWYHYTPAQVSIKTGIVVGRDLVQVGAGPGDGC
jgi:hypothetical protein